MSATLLVLLVTFFVLYSILTTIKPKQFPRGPRWYPFFGSGIILQKLTNEYGSQWKACLELSRQYSTKVLGLKTGSELLVVVHGEKNVRQVFNEKNFNSRPLSYFCELRCLGKRNIGITFANGETWKTHRQFATKTIKTVGYGKEIMEREIQYQMCNIVEYLENAKDPINVKQISSQSVINILWKLIAGERIEENKLKHLLKIFDQRSAAFSLTGDWLNTFPWCRYIIPNLSGYNLINKFNIEIKKTIEEAIEKHKLNKVQGSDFIYRFLEEMRTNQSGLFTDDQLRIVCLDMLIAGSETSGDFLGFAFLRAIKSPDIQNKIYEEIKTVLGNNTPCWEDRKRLIYTSAFILETHRYYTIAPIAGPRLAEKDTIVDGYLIPKGSTVLISLVDIHHDPELWEDPHEFKPERFIDENGDLINSKHLYIFGEGHRRCPGDELARSFTFITLVGVLQKYRVQSYDLTEPSDIPVTGMLSAPRPYGARFIPRPSS